MNDVIHMDKFTNQSKAKKIQLNDSNSSKKKQDKYSFKF